MSEVHRQLAMVIDLNKCMGCQTCTVACKVLWTNDKGMDHQWWMTVSSMPGRGYPKDWEEMGGGYDPQGNLALGRKPSDDDYGGVMDFNYDEVFYGQRGQELHLAPRVKPTWGPNWDEDIGGGQWPNAYLFYLPRLCNKCSIPGCAAACPYSAISQRPEDGIITVDQRACQSCPDPLCMAGCPYKEVYRNPLTLHAQKCNWCLPRIENGIAPACVRQCPGRCMWVDYLDNEEGSVAKLVKKWRVALPLHPEYRTGPNVFYVPPIAPQRHNPDGTLDISQPRIPTEYLRSLFGPGVDQALETLQAEMAKRHQEPKEPSELMDILIARRWHELLGPFTNDPSKVEVTA